MLIFRSEVWLGEIYRELKLEALDVEGKFRVIFSFNHEVELEQTVKD